MATYVPNADQLTEPVEARPAGSSAAEHREIKRKLEAVETLAEAIDIAALQIVAGAYNATADIDMNDNDIVAAGNLRATSVDAPLVSTDTLVVGGVTLTASDVGAAAAEVLRLDGSRSMTGQFRSSFGTLAAPGISFAGATDRGFGLRPDGTPRFIAGGVEAVAYNAAVWSFNVNVVMSGSRLSIEDGTEAAPSISFNGDTGSGLFRRASGNIGLSYNGAYFLEADAANLYVNRPLVVSGQVQVFPATAANHAVTLGQTAQAMFPRGSFTGDLNTLYTSGMYWAFDGITNLPAGAIYGIVEVLFPNNGNVCIQVYYPYEGRMPYFRASTGAPANPVGWSPWQQYATRGSAVGEQVYNAADQAAARAAIGVSAGGTIATAFAWTSRVSTSGVNSVTPTLVQWIPQVNKGAAVASSAFTAPRNGHVKIQIDRVYNLIADRRVFISYSKNNTINGSQIINVEVGGEGAGHWIVQCLAGDAFRLHAEVSGAVGSTFTVEMEFVSIEMLDD